MFGEKGEMRGLYYEAEVAWQGGTKDVEAFGRAVAAAFDASRAQSKPGGHRNDKSTDSPSYRASGLPSLKSFGETYVGYSLEGSNGANITVVATSQEVAGGISLTFACNPKLTLELGDTLRRMHEYYLRWQNR